MKLISLNIWGGHEFDALMSFLLSHSENTDIFCFQEVYDSLKSAVSNGTRTNIFSEFKKILPGHQSFFAPIQDNIDGTGQTSVSSTLGQALFIKKNLSVEKEGFIFTYRMRNAFVDNDLGTL